MSEEDYPRPVAGSHMFSALAGWGERAESAEALAERWLALVTRLQRIDPAFAHWMSIAPDGESSLPFVPTLEAQIACVTAGTDRHVSGRMAWSGGSRLNLYNGFHHSPCDFGLHMGAGNYGRYSSRNYVSISTDAYVIPEPHLVGFSVFRQLVLALAETFEATQAYAWPSDLDELWTQEQAERRDLPLAWISYVAPRFAMLVTPPPTVVVEHRPDGGLLMAATADRFTMADPAHLAAAQAIQAASQAFNAVPWTPKFGK